MADETEQAKAEKLTGTQLVRLASAGASDEFRVDDQTTITPRGVEVSGRRATELLEIAAANGVAVTVTAVDEKGK